MAKPFLPKTLTIKCMRQMDGYFRQLDRATGKVLYFQKIAPGCFCGGPSKPYSFDGRPLEQLPKTVNLESAPFADGFVGARET